MVNKCNENTSYASFILLFLPSLLSLFFLFSMENFRDLFLNSTYMLPLLHPSRTLQLDKYLSKYTNHLVNSFTTFPCACTLHTPKKKEDESSFWGEKYFWETFSSLGWCSSLWSPFFHYFLFILWTMLLLSWKIIFLR